MKSRRTIISSASFLTWCISLALNTNPILYIIDSFCPSRTSPWATIVPRLSPLPSELPVSMFSPRMPVHSREHRWFLAVSLNSRLICRSSISFYPIKWISMICFKCSSSKAWKAIISSSRFNSSRKIRRISSKTVVSSIQNLSVKALYSKILWLNIGGHNYYRVFKVYRSSLPIGKSAVIQYLKHHVKDIIMVFSISSKNYRIKYGRIPLIARLLRIRHSRGSISNYRMFLLILRHIDPDHGIFIIKEKLGQGPGQLSLSDSGRT